MRSVALCVLAFAACALAVNTGYAHLDGELIPTSPSVVIAGTEFTLGRDGDKMSFGDAIPNLQASAAAPASAAQADNPYIVRANKWDAEMLNTRAIARASNGISDLLKSVDTKIPEYIHKALRDYPDDDGVQHQQQPTSSIIQQQQAPPLNPMQGADQEDGAVDEFVDSFLEVAATRLTPLQRLRAATRQKTRRDAIEASIQLELEADASPAKGIERALNDELLSLNSDPQLKEWEEEAQWKQQRTDVHDALGSSDDLLSSIKNRYRHQDLDQE